MITIIVFLLFVVAFLSVALWAQDGFYKLQLKIKNDEIEREHNWSLADAKEKYKLKAELEAAQNAYLTLGRYIFENKEKLNNGN